MIYTYTFEIIREDKIVTLQAGFNIEPLIPGKFSALPENCYPDEGGYAEINESTIYLLTENKKWDDKLSYKEIVKIEQQAYEAWENEQNNLKDDLDIFF